MTKKQSPMQVQGIDHAIYLIRGRRVMLDEDLAKLYGVDTRVLNQAVRRNKDRFPADFMFQLSVTEFIDLKSQVVTSSWGGRRKRPLAFTEHGTVMLASILRSKRAVQMSIEVIKAFIRLRQLLASQKDVVRQLAEIRSFVLKRTNKIDREFKKVWKAIDDLTKPFKDKPGQTIGFKTDT
ncbi:MAG: ORF6N domain-containing protein [Candidatus Peregrinibacteria bacterium]